MRWPGITKKSRTRADLELISEKKTESRALHDLPGSRSYLGKWSFSISLLHLFSYSFHKCSLNTYYLTCFKRWEFSLVSCCTVVDNWLSIWVRNAQLNWDSIVQAMEDHFKRGCCLKAVKRRVGEKDFSWFPWRSFHCSLWRSSSLPLCLRSHLLAFDEDSSAPSPNPSTSPCRPSVVCLRSFSLRMQTCMGHCCGLQVFTESFDLWCKTDLLYSSTLDSGQALKADLIQFCVLHLIWFRACAVFWGTLSHSALARSCKHSVIHARSWHFWEER